MGHFSDLAVEYSASDRDDYVYVSPEKRLMLRLRELEDRLKDLNVTTGFRKNGYNYTKDDLRYVLPEHISDLHSLKRAIALAKDDLHRRYGIDVYDVQGQDVTETVAVLTETEGDYEQITFINMVTPGCIAA